MNEIYLDQSNFLDSGGARDVYFHPSNPDLCLKRQRVNGFQNYNEKTFLLSAEPCNLIPKYYGTVQTNLGECLSVELIKDFSGSVSKSLPYYLSHNYISQDDAIKYIKLLSNHFIKHRYLIHDGGVKNILLQKGENGEFQPVLVDGYGAKDRDFKNYIRLKFPLLGTIKTRKQTRIMINSLPRWASSN